VNGYIPDPDEGFDLPDYRPARVPPVEEELAEWWEQKAHDEIRPLTSKKSGVD